MINTNIKMINKHNLNRIIKMINRLTIKFEYAIIILGQKIINNRSHSMNYLNRKNQVSLWSEAQLHLKLMSLFSKYLITKKFPSKNKCVEIILQYELKKGLI
jgi:hypothetical protein